MTGTVLLRERLSFRSPTPPPPLYPMHCPHCGSHLEAPFAYCPSCAQPVTPARALPAREPTSRLPWVERAIVLGAVVFAVTLVAAPLGLTPRIDLSRLRGSDVGAGGFLLEPIRAEPDRFVMD